MNDVIVKTAARCLLTRYGIPESDDIHIRCIAHVINLMVQAFLVGMDEAEDPDELDWFEADSNIPLHYTPETDKDQVALEKEVDKEEANEAKLTSDQANAKALPVDKELEDLKRMIAEDQALVEEDEVSDISSQSGIKKVSCSNLFLHFPDLTLKPPSFVLLSQKLFPRHNAAYNSAKLLEKNMQGDLKQNVSQD